MILSLLIAMQTVGIAETDVLVPPASQAAMVTTHSEPQPIELQALVAAESALGSPYAYGASSPDAGFDCSGLVQWSYAQAGVDLPRSSYEQYASVEPTEDPKPGDLVFFHAAGSVSHVGIVTGDDAFIHAQNEGTGVLITPLDSPGWQGNIIGFGVVTND